MTASQQSIDAQLPIAVLGPGAWGSTLAWLYAGESKLRVRLWGRDPVKLERIRDTGSLEKPLRVEVPAGLEPEPDLDRALDGVSLVVLACTSQSMRELVSQVVKSLKRLGSSRAPVMVSAVKGLEASTLSRMSEVIEGELPDARVCCLSGPNLAYEIRSRLPCASVVASRSESTAFAVQELLSNRLIRLYTSTDLAGVELGGALKNVIAIAAGASDGLDLGVNAKAALLTRGLKEMTRLALRLGAQESTLFGLSGLGDLYATCQGSLSRNYRIGCYLARGKSLEEAVTMLGAVAEGITTTMAVCDLAEKLQVELPIAAQVKLVLQGRTTCEQCIMSLMSRPLAAE